MESPDLLDLTVLLAAILHRAEKWIGTQHGYLCLLNRNQNKMEIVYGTGAATPYGDPFISYDEGLAGKVGFEFEPRAARPAAKKAAAKSAG